MKKISLPKGSVPIIAVIVIIAVICLIGAGFGIYLMQFKKTAQAPAAAGTSGAPENANEITVSAPSLEFSFSAMPSLEVNSLNMQVPQVPGQGMFDSFSVDSDFMPTVDTNLEEPSYTFNPPPLPDRPTQPVPPTTPPTQPTQPTQPPPSGSTDCAQFTAVPSCSLVGAPGTPGYEACKVCYPNK